MQPLITGDPLSAVLARVTYRLIAVRFHQRPQDFTNPSDGIHWLSREMDSSGFPSLATWLAAAARACSDGWTLEQWREGVAYRSRRASRNRRNGKPWARVR